MNRLLIAVLGHRNSGKSKTWDTLFGYKVKTSKKQRAFNLIGKTNTEVFVISGSPQERKKKVMELLKDKKSKIVLCSIQYTDKGIEDAKGTFDYFIKRGFSIYVQWLNPGYKDASSYPDELGLWTYLQHQRSTLSIRTGKRHLSSRTREIREFLHGWAALRGLTF